eukprot:TRINITY_DN9079_c0_g1_i2.p1 TRINITY_DN9079_c0_g1~~TRINITY_DN9079_c0_g1_i2.p1  ORF type:complete len:672 (-),score=65.15 TRINITY_DN9079_c0_g1_i2:198-2213(-)
MADAREVKDANVAATDPEAALVKAPVKQEQLDGNDWTVPPLPDKISHRCTDPAWAVIIVLAVVGLTFPSKYALDNGNIGKFSHEFDYEGNLCGRDTCAGKPCGPYLFFCRLPDGSPDFAHPICKEICPKNNLTYSSCFDSTTNGVKLVPDYETVKYADKCLGARVGLNGPLVSPEFYAKMRAKSWTGKMIEGIDSVRTAKQTFAFSAMAVTLFAYVYLFVLKMVAAPALYVSMMLMIVVPNGVGLWGLLVIYSDGFSQTMQTQQGRNRFMFNLMFIAAGCIFGRLFCKMRKGFATAAGVLEASSACIFATPGILIEPLAMSVYQILIVCPFLTLCAGLYSTGRIVLVDADPQPYRNLEYLPFQILYLAYAHFMLLWTMFFVHCMSQYILCYIATRWYFIPVDEDGSKDHAERGWPFCDAVHNVFRFHFGSIALTSFLRVTLFIPQIVLNLVTYCPMRLPTPSDVTMSKKTKRDWFFEVLSWGRKTALMDMSITSADFFWAAPRGLAVIHDQNSAMAVLSATTLILKIACIGLSGVLGFAIGSVAIATEAYESVDSPHYLPAPLVVCIVHIVLGALLGWTFVNMYNVVGDVILFCVGLEETWWNDNDQSSCTDNDGSWTGMVAEAGRKNCGAYTGLGWLENHDKPQGLESSRRHQYAPDSLLQAIQDASDSE